MTQVAINESIGGLTSQIQQAIEARDTNAIYALAPELARLSLADLAPHLTIIQRGMQQAPGEPATGFSIRMLNALIREINLSHVGGRQPRNQDQSPAPQDTVDNIRSIEDYISFSDRGNAMRLLNLHGQDLRYSHAWKQWLIYDQGRWIMDETGAIIRRCENVIQSVYRQASESDDPKERKTLATWALKMEDYRSVNGMLNWACARPGVPAVPDDLDRDPWLLNVKNGTLDLRTRELRPHQRNDLITKQAPVPFDPDAQCSQWLAFLNRIMDGNQNLISFLQRAVGYSLTGSRKEHGLFMPHGRGKNGKSTFVDTLMDLLGDYAESTPTSTLMAKKSDGVPNDIARLKGVRFVAAQETEKGRRLAESLVKQITGDKRISARYMHANWFTFQPICKIWLSTNYKPVITGTDDGIWRRIHLIPFNVQIPENEQDKDLPEKLQAELSGILNWALAGCRAWQEQGLNPPEEVRAATNEYRDDQNTLRGFFEEQCVLSATARANLQDLYNSYIRWCEDNGEKTANILTKYQFNAHLKEQGYVQGRTGRARYWIGIGLLSPDSPNDPAPEPEQQTWESVPETHPEEPVVQTDQVQPDPHHEQLADQGETDALEPKEDNASPPTYAGTLYSHQEITKLYLQMAKTIPAGKKLYWDVAESAFPSQLVERSEVGTRLRTMIESKETHRVEAAVAWIRDYLSKESTPSVK